MRPKRFACPARHDVTRAILVGDHGRQDARVAAIIGTRPEAIKMGPVLRALRERGISTTLLCTGQHRGLDLPGCNVDQAPDAVLGFDPRGRHADAMCDAMATPAAGWLRDTRPEIVLVQGDTNSALAGARAAWGCGIPVGHVEAGLRTYRRDPWPEERNRVEIDAGADLLFAPTRLAVANLEREGVGGTTIMTGNSGMDALLDAACEVPDAVSQDGERLILVTVHRRENRGAGIVAIGEALRRIAQKEPVTFAVLLHPNAGARAELIAATRGLAGLRLFEPQGYRATVALMLRATLILSDSGGLQEEAPALGRPLLVLRRTTERPEAVASGNALLVGTDPDVVAGEALRLLRDDAARARMSVPAFPFGAGGASALIADAVADRLARPRLTVFHASPNPVRTRQGGPFV